MVVLGDSWIAGEHCSCTTFAGLWANDIEKQTSRDVDVTDLSGANEHSAVQDKTSGSLLWTLRHDPQSRQVVARSDIVLVSSGGNDLEPIGDQLINGTCGGAEDANCIRHLGHLWHRNFAAIAKTIAQLRGSLPTVIRFVAEGNFFLGSADLNSLVPPDFALTRGQLMARLYVAAVCDAARKYDARCVDGRKILSGPRMNHRFDENAPSTFRKIADALSAEGLSELRLGSTSDAEPAVGGRGGLAGHIIFTRAGGQFGDETVFAADADGSNQVRISDVGATCCPRISKDGSTVLEAAGSPDGRGTTALTDAHGDHRRLLPLPAGTLNLVGSAWSPDGTHIAADGWDDTHPHRNGLYLEGGDGSHAVRLTHAIPGGHDIPADFSPDGKRIAFIRTTPDAARPQGDIDIVTIRTGRVHQVRTGGLQPAYTVRWSPNGQWLAFSTMWTAPDVPLMVIRPNGHGLRAVFTDRFHRSVITPTWSPDGHQLMFGLARATGDEHPVDSLVVLHLREAKPMPVITTRDFKRLPDWVRISDSPQGVAHALGSTGGPE